MPQVSGSKKGQKMTHIDYQIQMLVQMGAESSEIGRVQLSSLNERKSLMAELGIENKATLVSKFPFSKSFTENSVGKESSSGAPNVSSLVLPKPISSTCPKPRSSISLKAMDDQRSKTLQPKNVVQVQTRVPEVVEPESFIVSTDKNLNKRSSQGVPSAYFLFLQDEREKLSKTDPLATIDRKALILTWKKMNDFDKKKFNDKVLSMKASLGKKYREDIRKKSLSDIEKKKRKKETDMKYRRTKKEAIVLKVKDDKTVKEKMEEIIVGKENKLSEVMTYVGGLKEEVLNLQKMNKEAVQSVVEKDLEILVLKEQYKNLHKLHKNCG